MPRNRSRAQRSVIFAHSGSFRSIPRALHPCHPDLGGMGGGASARRGLQGCGQGPALGAADPLRYQALRQTSAAAGHVRLCLAKFRPTVVVVVSSPKRDTRRIRNRTTQIRNTEPLNFRASEFGAKPEDSNQPPKQEWNTQRTEVLRDVLRRVESQRARLEVVEAENTALKAALEMRNHYATAPRDEQQTAAESEPRVIGRPDFWLVF